MRAFIIVCDRCQREERKNEPFGSVHAYPGWASVWHGCVAPLGMAREYEPEQHVCPCVCVKMSASASSSRSEMPCRSETGTRAAA